MDKDQDTKSDATIDPHWVNQEDRQVRVTALSLAIQANEPGGILKNAETFYGFLNPTIQTMMDNSNSAYFKSGWESALNVIKDDYLDKGLFDEALEWIKAQVKAKN